MMDSEEKKEQEMPLEPNGAAKPADLPKEAEEAALPNEAKESELPEESPEPEDEELPVSEEPPAWEENESRLEEESASIPKASVGGIVLKPLHLVIALLSVVVLMAGSVMLGMHLNRSSGVGGDIDPNAKDYEDIYANAGDVQAGSIVTPGYSDVVLPANTTDVQMVLLNPKGNPCYFRFTLVLEESGEEIYRSGLIPPGMAVTDLKLTRPLEAGSYRLLICIETESLEDRTPMNGMNVEAALTVRE